MPSLAKVVTHAPIARPLKTLVPLIQEELTAGNNAGVEHYRRAGEMLLEARAQVAQFKWRKWLSANFHLSHDTATDYMTLAAKIAADPSIAERARHSSLRSIVRPNRQPTSDQHWRHTTKDIAVDAFAEARKTRDDEIRIHRDLALELIDIGFKALATRLHPDRGGSKDSMRRLNRVRDELKGVAETRRFE